MPKKIICKMCKKVCKRVLSNYPFEARFCSRKCCLDYQKQYNLMTGKLLKGKNKMPKKVNHDYKCKECGKPAEINIQSQWHRWYIEGDGEFTGEKVWDGADNEFYCEKCAEDEDII